MDQQASQNVGTAQNRDGGWPYTKGISWTEPTVYALLAHQAGHFDCDRESAAAWLAGAQRPDGGWPPARPVDQSTWVTALVTLLPPEIIGADRYARAIEWLLGQSGMESTPAFHVREFLVNGDRPEYPQKSGWPWFPGTSAWVTPTCLGILALQKCYWRRPSPAVRERLERARNYLLSRRCADGGWNYGSSQALGYNLQSYPETTGQALLALEETDPGSLVQSLHLAHRLFRECRSSGGAAWLRLGLLAHQQLPAGTPFFSRPCRTIADRALGLLAETADAGRNIFLE